MEELLKIKKIQSVRKNIGEPKANYAFIDESGYEPIKRSPKLMQIAMISIIVITVLWIWFLIALISYLFFKY